MFVSAWVENIKWIVCSRKIGVKSAHFRFLMYKYGTGISCKEKFRKENFQTGFMVAGDGFLSYWNHQIIKFEEEKILRLL